MTQLISRPPAPPLPYAVSWITRSMTALQYTIPDASLIEDTVEVTFDIAPCKFQLQCAWAQLDRKDIITIAPMSTGKTLMFWIPLLFNNNSILILITALNGLGDQNIKELEKLSISAVNVTGANATDSTIQGMSSLVHYQCNHPKLQSRNQELSISSNYPEPWAYCQWLVFRWSMESEGLHSALV